MGDEVKKSDLLTLANTIVGILLAFWLQRSVETISSGVGDIFNGFVTIFLFAIATTFLIGGMVLYIREINPAHDMRKSHIICEVIGTFCGFFGLIALEIIIGQEVNVVHHIHGFFTIILWIAVNSFIIRGLDMPKKS